MYDDPHGWGMADGMGWAGWLMMTSVFLIGVSLVAVLIWAIVRSTVASGTSQGSVQGSTPGSIKGSRSAAQLTLDDRFARGEIDQPEYEQRSLALRGG